MSDKTVPYKMFGKTKMVPHITYTNQKEDIPAKSSWDDTLWIERGEDWYALSSLRNKTILVVKREDFINAEEYKTPLEKTLI
jgi:hypothetical protein